MWQNMASSLNSEVQETKVQGLVEYIYNNAYSIFIYSPLVLYAVNKEVEFVPQGLMFLRLKETSVTENHWSRRGKN